MKEIIMSITKKLTFVGLFLAAFASVGLQVAQAAPFDLQGNTYRDKFDAADIPLTLTPIDYTDGVYQIPSFLGGGDDGVHPLGSFHYITAGSGVHIVSGNIVVTTNTIETPEGHLTDTLNGKASTSSVTALAATVSSLGTPFAMQGFMLQESTSTTQYVATATTTGFMTASMVNKLASLNVVATSTPTVNSTNRTLNSCFQVSTTKDALVSYSVDVDSTVSLSGGAVGQVALQTFTNSGCTTGTITVQKGKAGLTGTLVVGLTLNNPATLTLGGVVTRGLWAELVTTNVTGTPTFTMNTTQEVTGNLTQ